MTNYPDRMTLRPLTTWPHPETVDRGRSPFTATWSATVDLLDRELYYLNSGPGNAPSILQIALREKDFRVDGMPRANAVVSFPGVILNIESSMGPLSYPCDKFDRWQSNLRAIALGLEALRKVKRYGIAPGNEQYVGWKALPQHGSGSGFTVEGAEEFLRSVVADLGNGIDIATIQQVYRRAARAAHPDFNGGDRTRWNRVEAAAATLRAAGRIP